MKSGPTCKKILVYFLFCLLFSFIFSCADTDPEIVNVQGYLIFDYQSQDEKPLVKLAAFVETSSDVHRVESINLKCLENNYSWQCSDPLIFANENCQWAGYTDFYLPVDENFKNGSYLLEYADAQEKTVSSSFSLSYPEENLKKQLKEITDDIKSSSIEEICVYDSAGTVLFYGLRRPSWKEDANIFSSIKNSSYFRISYVSNNDATIYILPAVYKNAKK